MDMPVTRHKVLIDMVRACFKVRPAFVLIGALMLVDAVAQTAATNRYPWDNRPAFCSQADAARDARCVRDDWPTWVVTLRRITDLYNSEQFALLERAMHEAVSSKKFFTNGDSPASAVYWAFRRMMPAPGTPEEHQRKISRWKTAVPSSDYAAFAEARFLYASAWDIRGTGRAGSVSPESWDLFGMRLQEAEQLLLNSSKALKRTPIWHNLLLAIVLDNPRSKTDPDALFNEAVRRWPRYFELYELRLTRLVPKWGGSWEKVEGFIDRWTRDLSSSEGNSLYARLYISLRNQGVTPDETNMDWVRMKASFDDLTNRYPSSDFKNLYASYACFARDKNAFNAALAKLAANELDKKAWLVGHSYEACMRWAAI
jgi:hypothetical protein